MTRYFSIIAFLFVLLTAANAVEACSCPKFGSRPEEQEVNASVKDAAALFVGKVIKVSEPKDGERSVEVEFRVDRAWLGAKSSRMTIRTEASSAACGYSFEEGLTYIVYAYRYDDVISVGLCSRTRIIKGQNGSPDEKYLGVPSYVRPIEK